MQFTLMVFETARGFAARTDPHERDAYWRGTFAFLHELRASGAFRGGAGLEPPALARHLEAPGPAAPAREGPVAEGPWQLGGYFIVEAADTEAALAIARRFPARAGTAIEVRPNLPQDGAGVAR